MKGSIRKQIGFFTALLFLVFIILSFAATGFCLEKISNAYRNSVANDALDFSELSISSESARISFLTRNPSDAYKNTMSKLCAYQDRHSDTVKRISLIKFSNTSGIYIYDTGGKTLGERTDLDDYMNSVKSELLSGRNSLTHIEDGIIYMYRPIRTVDDDLCGYLIVEIEAPFEREYFSPILIVHIALVLLSILFSVGTVHYLNRELFRPIQRITEAAVYLSGDDTASEGMDASVMLRTKRTDEIGRLSKVLQKIFFDMNTGAEHLSQALYDANHDGMTQHLNKRCYHSMEETFRSCNPICVFYFDVNNLKLMNDTLGHENGDYVIKQAADYIRGLLGEGDYCFRMGGDEFLVVMTACSFRSAEKLLDRLDSDAPYILSREEDSIKCALSYGFAFAAGDKSYEEVLAEAEGNMYQKKTELKELLHMPER